MRMKTFMALIVGVLLVLPACSSSKNPSSDGGFSTIASLPTTPTPTPTTSPTTSNVVQVTLGETDSDHMFINLSGATATAGDVSFVVTNSGTHTHEFVVLQTDTAASAFPIASFEGEDDRIDEDTAGVNVGETGDMEPGTTMTLNITMTAGHYALVCNLPGHYRMGMHQDFQVT
jgi:uncharacterized cupredoxin-like copper-binding protein